MLNTQTLCIAGICLAVTIAFILFSAKMELKPTKTITLGTHPTSHEASEYLINSGTPPNADFMRALKIIETNLADDPCNYGQLLGEIYAFSKYHLNVEKAYYFYHIGLSQDGFSTGFKDLNGDPPHYGGPVGDFRNESQVSELVDDLGYNKIKEIDAKAEEWLKNNHFITSKFLHIKD